MSVHAMLERRSQEYMEACREIDAKNARITALESELAAAREALTEAESIIRDGYTCANREAWQDGPTVVEWSSRANDWLAERKEASEDAANAEAGDAGQ